MRKIIKYRSSLLWLGLLALLAGGCQDLIARHDPVAYEMATSLKAESLALMSKAVEPYDQHEDDVDDLVVEVEKAYEYNKGRKKNELMTRQYEILKAPDRNLLGGFLKRWKEDGQLGAVFVDEMKLLVSKAYDQIIGLEAGLIRPDDLD